MLKIAILNADKPKDHLKQWGDFADMAIKLLEETRQPQDQVEYVTFQVYKDDFPDLEDLKSSGYAGIYITGSVFDSFANDISWIVKMRQLLNTILTESGYPPVAGICFGHQIIAASLGCKVDRNPAGFEGGVVSIQLSPEAIGMGLFQKADCSGSEVLRLSEVHNDIVFEVPEGFINLGSSEKCQVQGFYKKGKVLSFQGHPEFVTEVALILAELSFKVNGAISKAELERIKDQTSRQQNDGVFASQYIWKLFRGEL